jgi:hypothetical protein
MNLTDQPQPTTPFLSRLTIEALVKTSLEIEDTVTWRLACTALANEAIIRLAWQAGRERGYRDTTTEIAKGLTRLADAERGKELAESGTNPASARDAASRARALFDASRTVAAGGERLSCLDEMVGADGLPSLPARVAALVAIETGITDEWIEVARGSCVALLEREKAAADTDPAPAPDGGAS